MKSQITDIFAEKLAKTVIPKVAEAMHLSFVFDRKSLKIPVAAFAANAKTLDFTADLETDFEKYPQNTHNLPATSRNLPTFYPQLPANYPQFTRNFPQFTRKLPATSRKLPAFYPQIPDTMFLIFACSLPSLNSGEMIVHKI